MATPPSTLLAYETMKKSRRRRRGAVMVEYTLLLTTVGVMSVAGITAAGKTLLRHYNDGRQWILLPVP